MDATQWINEWLQRVEISDGPRMLWLTKDQPYEMPSQEEKP